MSVNDLRKDNNQYNEQELPGPDVPSNSCQVGGGPDAIFSLCLSSVFCLDYPILPYALSFYLHFVLRPLHLMLCLLGFHPPQHHTGMFNNYTN